MVGKKEDLAMLYFRRRVDDVHKKLVLISRIGLFLALPSSPTLIMPLFLP